MIQYLRAKAIEYQSTLNWIEDELRRLQLERPDHNYLISELIKKLDEPKDLLRKLQVISSLNHPSLISRGKSFIHQIEYWVVILTYYYLPALRKEKADDAGFGKLLLDISNRLGLSWISDIVVRLDGGLATFSVFPQAPVFFAPPQQYISLIDAPGIYHEFGHNVTRYFPNIINVLLTIVKNYFITLQQKAGPLSPAQQKVRLQAINDAIDYWQDVRLDELFCDIYATYVSGPAHYYSCVDMALRDDRDPYKVDFADVHPPLAARVKVCRKALPTVYQLCKLVGAIENIWTTHNANYNSNSNFDLLCMDDLLENLTNASISEIAKSLPSLKRFDRQISVLMSNTNPKASVEDILNVATNILLTQPGNYQIWEKTTLQQMIGNL